MEEARQHSAMTVDPIIGALIALSSGLAGAFFQALLGRRSEYIKAGRQARYEAYSDYFRGIAQISHLSDGEDESAALMLIANARGRIALYGSPAVVEAMSKVFDHGEDLRSSTARSALTAMLTAMREDVLWIDSKVRGEHLVSVVFGRDGQAQ
jgi:hypothetical protein